MLVSDSRAVTTSSGEGGGSSWCPLRLEWQVTLMREKRRIPDASAAGGKAAGGGEGSAVSVNEMEAVYPYKTINIIYYVNEDFTTFWPPEMVVNGCMAVLFSSKVSLPLWREAWTQRLAKAASPSALLVSDSTTMCEPPMMFLFMAAEESRFLTRASIENTFLSGFLLPMLKPESPLPLLHPILDVIAHSSKSAPGEEGFTVRVLCCWQLSSILGLASKVTKTVVTVAGPSVLSVTDRMVSNILSHIGTSWEGIS